MPYNPNQPRVPAGSGDPSGQWAPASGSTSGGVQVSSGDYAKVIVSKGEAKTHEATVRVPKGASLQKPIVGASGAKIIGYVWQSKIDDVFSKREGGMVGKRVSDWDASDISTGTGREIVHHYYVEHKDGSVTLEGVRSAEKILAGISDDDKKTLSGLTSAIKTARKWEAEVQETEDFIRRGEQVEQAVEALPLPAIVAITDLRGAGPIPGWQMGDAKVWAYGNDRNNPSEIPEERKKALVESWRINRVNETFKGDPARSKSGGPANQLDAARRNLAYLREQQKKAAKKVKLFLKDEV